MVVNAKPVFKGMTMREACVYLGNISRPSMYKLMASGEVPSYKIHTRRYFRIDDLDAFMKRQIESDQYENR